MAPVYLGGCYVMFVVLVVVVFVVLHVVISLVFVVLFVMGSQVFRYMPISSCFA